MKPNIRNVDLIEIANSSNVKFIGYDGETKQAFVFFAGREDALGGAYVYDGVERQTIDTILSSHSPGKEVSKSLVRSDVKYRKLDHQYECGCNRNDIGEVCPSHGEKYVTTRR